MHPAWACGPRWFKRAGRPRSQESLGLLWRDARAQEGLGLLRWDACAPEPSHISYVGVSSSDSRPQAASAPVSRISSGADWLSTLNMSSGSPAPWLAVAR